MNASVPLRIAISLALAAAACAIYAQTAHFDFVNLDDPAYLLDNPLAQRGLGLDSFRWAFSTLYLANYTPLTWLTYFADFQRAGLDPGAYHLTNFLFHAANSALLFLALHALTRRTWPSALAAALFAVHPLHVESVAWISERKDVVSTFFGLLALWAYAAYARAPRARTYIAVFALLVCSLLAKSMLVTFPFLLLVLDFWPLDRATPRWADRHAWLRLVLEKLPLFVLVAAISGITLIAQREADALPSTDLLGMGARLNNAAVSYVRYLGLTLWPHDLIPYYPHPKRALSAWQIAGGAAVLASASVAAWRLRVRAPYLLAGWLWFLGTLFPVIGLVQVGGQAMADRYTYVPLTGIFIAAAWALADLAARLPRARIPLAAACMAALAALGLAAHAQAARWRDSITLYEYALRISPANPVVLGNLGDAYLQARHYEDAVATSRRALAVEPDSIGNRRNLSRALRKLGRFEEAAQPLLEAIHLRADDAATHSDLGLVFMDLGRLPAARAEFERAIEIDPALADAHVNYGNLFVREDLLSEAESQYRRALELEPRSADALSNLGALHLLRKEYGQAEVAARRALAIKADDAITRTNLAAALMELGDLAGARREAEAALHTDPDYAKARALLETLDRRIAQ
jgi:tetratricopeptide (TPR) repeat protein